MNQLFNMKISIIRKQSLLGGLLTVLCCITNEFGSDRSESQSENIHIYAVFILFHSYSISVKVLCSHYFDLHCKLIALVSFQLITVNVICKCSQCVLLGSDTVKDVTLLRGDAIQIRATLRNAVIEKPTGNHTMRNTV